MAFSPLASTGALFTLDDAIASSGITFSAEQRQAIALSIVTRANWQAAESNEPWRTRHARLRDALAHGRVACLFDRVGRQAGGATWTPEPAGDALRLHDFWARPDTLRAVVAAVRDRIGTSALALTYQRMRRGTVRTRVHRHALLAHPLPGSLAASGDSVVAGRGDLRDELSSQLRQSLAHGEILHLLAQSPNYAALSTAAVLQLTARWTGVHQFRLYRDAQGHPAGLLAWAWLSDRTIADLPRLPLHRLPHSEWNEGERLCLADIIVTPAARNALFADIAGALHPDEAEVLTYHFSDGKPAITAWPAADRPRLARLAVPGAAP